MNKCNNLTLLNKIELISRFTYYFYFRRFIDFFIRSYTIYTLKVLKKQK